MYRIVAVVEVPDSAFKSDFSRLRGLHDEEEPVLPVFLDMYNRLIKRDLTNTMLAQYFNDNDGVFIFSGLLRECLDLEKGAQKIANTEKVFDVFGKILRSSLSVRSSFIGGEVGGFDILNDFWRISEGDFKFREILVGIGKLYYNSSQSCLVRFDDEFALQICPERGGFRSGVAGVAKSLAQFLNSNRYDGGGHGPAGGGWSSGRDGLA